MVAENIFVVVSGTALNFTGSHCVVLNILCGVSGNMVIPVQVTNNGILLTGSIGL